MQNTTGKLMGRIVARKLTEDFEKINVLPPNRGGYRAEKKTTWENAARLAYDVYEGSQMKEQTLAVAVDLEHAYNRVQLKLLLEHLVQYGVSLTLSRWLATALQERKIAKRLGNWISTPPQLTMGPPQGSPCSMSSTMSASGILTAVTVVQEKLEKVSHWCQETESGINIQARRKPCGAPSRTKQ